MAIQNRRGQASDFVPSKLLPGEFAVVQSGDSNTTDGKAAYLAFASGSVKRLITDGDIDALTYDLENDIESVSGDLEELASTVGNVSSTAESALIQANANQAAISNLESSLNTTISNVRSTAESALSKANTNEGSIAEAFFDITNLQRELENVSIDPDDLGLYQDPDTGYVYPTYRNVVSENGIPLASGGGGGGGGSQNNAILTVSNTSGWLSKTISENSTNCNISMNWSSLEDDIPTGNGTLNIKVGGILRSTQQISQGGIVIDVKPYLTSGLNNVGMQISDIYGNSRTIKFSITMMALTITSTFDSSQPFSGAITFPYVPIGTVQKTIYFIVDGVEIGRETTSVSGSQISYVIPARSHGSHSLRVYFDAVINNETVRSNELYYEIICVEQHNYNTIITTSFDTESVEQYSLIIIPYRVYNPSSETAEITLAVNGATVSSQEVGREEQYFSYRANDPGDIAFTITSGNTVKTINFTVNASSIDVHAETENLALYLNASGRSNNEAPQARQTWKYENSIVSTFTNFGWRRDGWLTDSDGVDVLRLVGDARVTIPYKIFETDFKTSGKTIEIEFSTREVSDYSATILSCYADGIGLYITPQMVYFAGAQTNISTLYKDNEHVRLSIVVAKQTSDRLLLIYINGVMSRAIQYASGERFSQTTPVNISIGSNDCGIDIYNIRVYDNDLSRVQVLNNWIADTQIGSLMLERYVHNNIYGEHGEITPSNLPMDLPYMIIESELLPQYKGDNERPVSGTYEDRIYTANSFSFSNVKINVQGTSSAPYFRKNYDMQFRDGFITPNGVVSNYALRTDSIPFNRFVLKADVASSEGANNVELVMLYNDICPYKIPEMVVNEHVRWGIEGIPIALFWYDTVHQETKFLGKANFNLPKRSPTPYGYLDNGTDESWEWERNNSANVKFKDNDFTTMHYDAITDTTYPEWYDDFEARFPSDAWRDTTKLNAFISFVLSTWRDEATGVNLSSSVTYRLRTTATVSQYPSDSSYTIVEETDQDQTTWYNITFTKDTPAYRLTKFRAEFPDYAELDSFLFYYIFTETFTMIDSRAKNMFIGFHGGEVTKSGILLGRKAVCEPYDMDTAIGTNNSGVLMFGYALEDTDTVSAIVSGSETGGSNAPVYNAQDSVLWCNVRDAFKGEIASMYQSLRSNPNWNWRAIENRFENHQSKWCEALFNEDAYQKYLVPLVENVTYDESTGTYIKTDEYLTMLQGSKQEQRKWWLFNRFRYLDSKWATGDAQSNIIMLRLFGSGTLTLTPAIDMYLGVSFGGGTTPEIKRTTANTSQSFVYTTPSGVTEMETWIWSGDMITDVGDLSVFYPNEFRFSRASRLKTLKIGDEDSEYSNANLTTLDVSNSPMLEYIDLRNCPNLAITVNLENSPRLREAYFEGTSITGVDLADGAEIETLHLPETVTALVLTNLSKLDDLVCESYGNISRLMLSNIDQSIIDPIDILEVIQPGSQVNIQGMSYEMEDAEEIEEFLALLDTMSGVSRERSRITNEWIYYEYDTAQVSGTIHTGSLTGSQIASYNERYPYITITADHTTADLRYYTYDGGTLLYTETITDGGNGGSYSGQPTREATAANTFTFIGWSKSMNAIAADADALTRVVADRNVYAAYSITGQTYRVRFYNGSTLLQEYSSIIYGGSATYTGETPEYSGSESGEFEFTGFLPTGQNITGNTDCYAQYADMSSPVLKYLRGSLTEYESETNTDKIGEYAFYNMNSLERVEAPVASVENGAFNVCANLETVDLTGASAVSIASAFVGCHKLKDLIIRSASVSSIVTSSPLKDTKIANGLGGVYVPRSLVSSYKSASNWSSYTDSIFAIEDYPITDFSTIEDSWAEIFAAEDNGTYLTRYSVGDTKKLSINGNDVYMQIVAFDTDELFNETGTAKITWVSKFITDLHKFNEQSIVTDGWAVSGVRAWLINEVLPTIDYAVRSRIKEVTKTYYDLTTDSTLSVKDTLWIPSARETGASMSNSAYKKEDSGVDYESFFNSSTRRAKIKADSGATHTWILRTPYSSSAIQCFASSGITSTTTANNNSGIVFGFCT